MRASIKKPILVCGILASCICLSATCARARGKVSSSGYKTYKGAKTIDGDTYKYKGQRYRLRDYNAPEIGQTGSGKAAQKLQRKLNSGNYEYKPVAKDAYGRSVVKERKKNK